jgi:putative flippase GtrA
MKKFVDIKILKFLLVGVLNTLLSAIIMSLLYNVFKFGYWGASSIAYIIGGVVSFILNKRFTFKNHDSVITTGVKFAFNIIICYLVAYSLAKPIIIAMLHKTAFNDNIVDNVALLFGMVLFTTINYFGQRYFAFKEKSN